MSIGGAATYISTEGKARAALILAATDQAADLLLVTEDEKKQQQLQTGNFPLALERKHTVPHITQKFNQVAAARQSQADAQQTEQPAVSEEDLRDCYIDDAGHFTFTPDAAATFKPAKKMETMLSGSAVPIENGVFPVNASNSLDAPPIATDPDFGGNAPPTDEQVAESEAAETAKAAQ